MRKLLIPVVATALTVAVMAFQSVSHAPELVEALGLSLHPLTGYTFEDLEESEAERNLLPSDTLFAKRAYTDGEGRTFQVVLVTNGRRRASIHRPEVCLPAHGFRIREPRTVTVGDIDWRVITVERGSGERSSFAYTAVNQTGYRTSSHFKRIFWDVWDRGILGRIDRWSQVSVYAPGEDEAELRAFLGRIPEVVR